MCTNSDTNNAAYKNRLIKWINFFNIVDCEFVHLSDTVSDTVDKSSKPSDQVQNASENHEDRIQAISKFS